MSKRRCRCKKMIWMQA